MKTIVERYKNQISFELGCYDRLILTGTLPEISYAQGMTAYLKKDDVRIFDYPRFAEPYKEVIRSNAERIAKEEGVGIEFVRKAHIRKEDLVAEKIRQRGNQPGLVHIISTMELCTTFKPWHDKKSADTFLKPDQNKCLHYYFYFIDEQFGLGYIRVPTWCPFRLQVYVNGHNLLASRLKESGIEYCMIDNAFDSISDPARAQELSDSLSAEKLHRKLDELACRYCPIYSEGVPMEQVVGIAISLECYAG